MNETKEELDKAMKNGINDGLLMTQGRWCNRIQCPKNKLNWCKEDVCVYGVSLIQGVNLTPDLTQGVNLMSDLTQGKENTK